MTKRGKIMLLCASLLALCVIASSIFFLAGVDKNAGDVSRTIILYATIGLAVVSVGVVYLWKVRRKGYEKFLNAEYFDVYEAIRDAIAISQLSVFSKREVAQDVLDMLLTAQRANRPVQDVVGDPAAFSQEILRAFSSPRRFAYLSLFDGFIGLALYILASNTLLWLENMDISFFDVEIGISLLIFFAIIAFVLLPVTKWLASVKGAWAYILPLAFGISFVLVMQLLRKYLFSVSFIRILLDGTVVLIPSLLVCAAYIIAVPLLFFVKAQVRKRMIRTVA